MLIRNLGTGLSSRIMCVHAETPVNPCQLTNGIKFAGDRFNNLTAAGEVSNDEKLRNFFIVRYLDYQVD